MRSSEARSFARIPGAGRPISSDTEFYSTGLVAGVSAEDDSLEEAVCGKQLWQTERTTVFAESARLITKL